MATKAEMYRKQVAMVIGILYVVTRNYPDTAVDSAPLMYLFIILVAIQVTTGMFALLYLLCGHHNFWRRNSKSSD